VPLHVVRRGQIGGNVKQELKPERSEQKALARNQAPECERDSDEDS